jgi:hypothetical protein
MKKLISYIFILIVVFSCDWEANGDWVILKIYKRALCILYTYNINMKNILIVLFSSLFCQVFSQQNNNDSIKEKLIDTLYITSRINETTVEKSNTAVNIGDDKEFALKFDKTKSKCFLEKIIINVKNFEPNETTQNYLRLRFYSSENNGSIGEILSNNELFVKLLKESKKLSTRFLCLSCIENLY